MSKEVMQQALEALNAATRYGAGGFEDAKDALRAALAKPDFWEGYVPEPVKPAPPECQTEAEKTAYAFGWWKALESQRALDKKAENARELGLDYEPAQQEPVACVYKATTKKGETAHFGEYSVAKAWAGWGTVEQVPLKTLTLVQKSIQPCSTCEALARAVMFDQTSHDAQRKPLTDKQILADETLRYYFGQNGGAGPVSKQGRKIVNAIEALHNIKETEK